MKEYGYDDMFWALYQWQMAWPVWIKWVLTGMASVVAITLLVALFVNLFRNQNPDLGKRALVSAGMLFLGIGAWNIPAGLVVATLMLFLALIIKMIAQIATNKGPWFVTFVAAFFTFAAGVFIYAMSWDIILYIAPWFNLKNIFGF